MANWALVGRMLVQDIHGATLQKGGRCCDSAAIVSVLCNGGFAEGIYLSKHAFLCVTSQNVHGLLQQTCLQNNKQAFCMCDCSKYLLKVTAVFLSEVLPTLIN